MGGVLSRGSKGGVQENSGRAVGAAKRSQKEAIRRTRMPAAGEGEAQSQADAEHFNQMLVQLSQSSLKQRNVIVSGHVDFAGAAKHNTEASASRLPPHELVSLLAGSTSVDQLRGDAAPSLDDATVALARRWTSAVNVQSETVGNRTRYFAVRIVPDNVDTHSDDNQ